MNSLLAFDFDVFGACATPLRYGVTTYAVIAAPLELAGTDHFSFARPWPVAVEATGRPGVVGVPAVTGFEYAEIGDDPNAFAAETVNRYVLPFCRLILTDVPGPKPYVTILVEP